MAERVADHTFHLTVHDRDGRAENRQFTVNLTDTVADVVAELGATELTNLAVGRTGKTLRAYEVVGEIDLRSGDAVWMVEPSGQEALDGSSFEASIEILTGPRVGERLTVESGQMTFGRAADNALVIIDPGVSRFHGSLDLAPDGTLTVHDNDSTNGVMVEEGRVHGSQVVEPGQRVLVGQTWFVATVKQGNELGMPRAEGAILGALNSVVVPTAQPVAPSDPLPRVEFPNLPSPSWGGLFRARRQSDDEVVAAFRSDLKEMGDSIERLQQIEMANRQAAGPATADLLTGAAQDPPAVWRFVDRDGLAVRIGAAPLASDLAFVLPPGGDPALREEMIATAEQYRRLDGAPVMVNLGNHSLVRISGDPAEAHGLARSVVAQLALRYGPSNVSVGGAMTGPLSDDWKWLTWLPHCRQPDGPGGANLAWDSRSAGELVAALAELSRSRSAQAGHVVLLLDGHAAGDPGLGEDLADLVSGQHSVTVVIVADVATSSDGLLADRGSTASIGISDGFGTLVTDGRIDNGEHEDGHAVMAITCEALGVDDADEMARLLAPMVEADPTAYGESAPDDIGAHESTLPDNPEPDNPEPDNPSVDQPSVDDQSVSGDEAEYATGYEMSDDVWFPASPVTDHNDDSFLDTGKLFDEPAPAPVDERIHRAPIIASAPIVESAPTMDPGQLSSRTPRTDFFRSDDGATRPTARGEDDSKPFRARSPEQDVIATTWERSEKASSMEVAFGVQLGNGNLAVGCDFSDGRLVLVDGVSDAYLAQVLAGMAVAQSPFKVNFVLLDALGGRMLASCDHLPHTVAAVTKPSPAATKSALAALAAELDRREALMATLGCDTVAELHRSGSTTSVPYLVVVVSDPIGSILGRNGPGVADGLWGESIVTVDAAAELVELARRGADLGLFMIVGRSSAPDSDDATFAGVTHTLIQLGEREAMFLAPGEPPFAFTPTPPRMAALNPDSLDRLVSVLADVFRSSGRPEPVSLSL